MAAPPRDRPVPYYTYIIRWPNLNSTLTNIIYGRCHLLVANNKAIYTVLKDHVKSHLPHPHQLDSLLVKLNILRKTQVLHHPPNAP
jgi:hypothetical protein